MRYPPHSVNDSRKRAVGQRVFQLTGVYKNIAAKALALVLVLFIYGTSNHPVLLAADRDEAELLAGLESNNKGTVFVAARALGRLESARGLQELIDRRDNNLLQEYVSGFKDAAIIKNHTLPPFPDEIEKLVVQHFYDQNIGEQMSRLRESRYYTSPELFDMKLSLFLRHGKEKNTAWLESLAMTEQPAFLEAMLKTLPQLSEQLKYRLLFILGSRGYAPATVPIAEYLTDETGQPRYRMGDLYRGLVKIGTQQSMDLLISHLAKFRRTGADERDYKEVVNLLYYIMSAPPEVPVDVNLLGKSIPYLQSDNRVLGQYIGVIKTRKLKPLAADLYAYLGNTERQRYVFTTLMEFDDPVIWRKTKAEVERLKKAGNLDDNVYKDMSREFDRTLGNQKKYFSEKRDWEFNGEMHREMSKYEIARRDLQTKKGKVDPAQFIEEYRELLLSMEELAKKYASASQVPQINTDISNASIELGSYARFNAGLPQQAIQFYEAALPISERAEIPVDFVLYYLIADTYRFDVGETDKAISYYRLALQAINDRGVALPTPWLDVMPFWRRWLQKEMDFLTNGTVFQGEIGRNEIEECGATIMLLNLLLSQSPQALYAYLGWEPRDEQVYKTGVSSEVAIERINSIAKSQLLLAKTIQYLPFLKDWSLADSIIEARDPAHYLSGCILGMQLHALATTKEQESEDQEASHAQDSPDKERIKYPFPQIQSFTNEFQQNNRISFSYGVDARLATPEQTWQLFLDSLRSGDRETVKLCFSSDMRQKWKKILSSLTNEQLGKMAEGISELTGGYALGDDIQVFYSSRKKQGGEIWFRKVGAEWLIGEM